jgi:glycosyltransferase involved in cell wall biosynthesis
MSSSSLIRLSVIVAAQDAGSSLKECIAALVPQLPPSEMEIVVVDGSDGDRARASLGSGFPVKILRGPSPPNVPQLWITGIQAAQGRIVALTIENCVPAADWASQMLNAHAGAWAGVGGAIEIAAGAGLVDWAVYFSRYSNYLLPFEPRLLDDVAGDNCSYKREALEPVRDLAKDGFWETFIHQDMRRRGQQLWCTPSPVVTYCGGLSGWRFFRRRFLHGRYFAARRSREFTAGQRVIRACGSLVVPFVLLRRIATRVWRNGRHRAKLVMVIPMIAAFLVAWAAGEGTGYWQGPSGARASGRD